MGDRLKGGWNGVGRGRKCQIPMKLVVPMHACRISSHQEANPPGDWSFGAFGQWQYGLRQGFDDVCTRSRLVQKHFQRPVARRAVLRGILAREFRALNDCAKCFSCRLVAAAVQCEYTIRLQSVLFLGPLDSSSFQDGVISQVLLASGRTGSSATRCCGNDGLLSLLCQ